MGPCIVDPVRGGQRPVGVSADHCGSDGGERPCPVPGSNNAVRGSHGLVSQLTSVAAVATTQRGDDIGQRLPFGQGVVGGVRG